MNYTEKYHLPQWVKSDRIMMDDFNRMCADMEAGLEKTARDAAADTAAAKSEALSVTAQAQSTADTAVSKADAARAVADAAYCPTFKPYRVGSYTGSGSGTKTIEIGFKPSFIIITDQVALFGTGGVPDIFAAGPTTRSASIKFLSNGFSVTAADNMQPNLNGSQTFSYIAFR